MQIVVVYGASAGIREPAQSRRDTTAVRIDLVEQYHRGHSSARNSGAAVAHGQRILFGDSDVLAGEGVLAFHASRPRDIYRGAIAHLPWLARSTIPCLELSPRALRLGHGAICALASQKLPAAAVESPTLLQDLARTTLFERDRCRRNLCWNDSGALPRHQLI